MRPTDHAARTKEMHKSIITKHRISRQTK